MHGMQIFLCINVVITPGVPNMLPTVHTASWLLYLRSN